MQRSILHIIFIVFLLFRSSISHEIPSEEIHEMWRKFQEGVDITMEKYRQKIIPALFLINSHKNITSMCLRDITDIVLGIINQKSWAFRMIDATAKLPSGILDGSFLELGDYDECLDIVKLQANGDMQFTGQYCKVASIPFIPPKPSRVQYNTRVVDVSSFALDSVWVDFFSHVAVFYQIPFLLGICVPSSCSVDDMQQMMRSALKNTPFYVKIPSCEAKEPIRVSAVQTVCLAIIVLLVALGVLGTIVDSLYFHQDVEPEKCKKTSPPLANSKKIVRMHMLKGFSIRRNLRNLFITTSKEHFSALDGLRSCYLFLIVESHSYIFSMNYGANQLRNVQEDLDNIVFSTFIVSMHAADIFFVIAAFLVSYLGLKSLHQNNGRLNFFQFYLNRLWRIFPPLAGTLLIVFLLPMLGYGPLYKDIVVKETEKCERNWWKVLLMIFNSWAETETGCLVHTWYISCDLIYYLVSPVFLIALYRSPQIGFTMILMTALASIFTIGSVTYVHDLYSHVLIYTPDDEFRRENMDLIHYRPYTHAAPYCVGLALGYIFYHYREVPIKKIYQVTGWCVSITLLMVVRLTPFEWNRGNLPPKAVEIIYASLHRTVWSIGHAWIMYMCITGRGGIVNRFLSSSFFIPISRLSFVAYLCHFFCIWLRNGVKRTFLPFQVYDVVYFTIGDFIMSIFLSVILYLMFEAPAMHLKEMVFPKKTYKKLEH